MQFSLGADSAWHGRNAEALAGDPLACAWHCRRAPRNCGMHPFTLPGYGQHPMQRLGLKVAINILVKEIGSLSPTRTKEKLRTVGRHPDKVGGLHFMLIPGQVVDALPF